MANLLPVQHRTGTDRRPRTGRPQAPTRLHARLALRFIGTQLRTSARKTNKRRKRVGFNHSASILQIRWTIKRIRLRSFQPIAGRAAAKFTNAAEPDSAITQSDDPTKRGKFKWAMFHFVSLGQLAKLLCANSVIEKGRIKQTNWVFQSKYTEWSLAQILRRWQRHYERWSLVLMYANLVSRARQGLWNWEDARLENEGQQKMAFEEYVGYVLCVGHNRRWGEVRGKI
jgi:hypothetical protein